MDLDVNVLVNLAALVFFTGMAWLLFTWVSANGVNRAVPVVTGVASVILALAALVALF